MVAKMICQNRIEGEEGHRARMNPAGNPQDLGIPAMVARPVSKDEIKQDRDDERSKAVKAEWDKLKFKGVLDFETVQSWREAAQDARRNGRTKYMGRAFGIMVKKNYELRRGDIRRKMKYRVVFQGNNVHTANWQTACWGQARAQWKQERLWTATVYSQETMENRLMLNKHVFSQNGQGQLLG